MIFKSFIVNTQIYITQETKIKYSFKILIQIHNYFQKIYKKKVDFNLKKKVINVMLFIKIFENMIHYVIYIKTPNNWI